MRFIIKRFVIAVIVLFLTSYLFSGLVVSGGFTTYIVGAVLLSLGLFVLNPIVSIVTLPLKIITFGISNALTFGLVLLIITYLDKNIQVVPFVLNSMTILGVSIQSFKASGLLEYVLISVTMYLIYKFLEWIIE